VAEIVTRRDFLNGVAIAIGAGLAPIDLLRAQSAGVHPPALTGWRGGIDSTYGVAHAVRDGQRFDLAAAPVEEKVDLVVVGAGISGLTAAWLFRKAQPRARILIVEAHDDFGGHAARNEFTVGDRLLLSYGGSESLQSPSSLWSRPAKALLADLGVNIRRFETAFDRTLYPGLGLSRGVFFTREAFGVDRLVTGDPLRMVADDIPADRMNARSVEAFIADFPLDAGQKARLVALYTERRDVLAGNSRSRKEALLASKSYRDFIQKRWGLDDTAANTFQGRSLDFFAVGIDALPASDAMDTGYPGFQGLGLAKSAEGQAEMDEPYIHHFPDGNASLARLLVRKLIPEAAPGSTMDDVVTTRFDYGQLDVTGRPARLRLGATLVAARNGKGGVDLGIVKDGKLARMQAGAAIFAGYNMMLPYLMPELPARQRAALALAVKAPQAYVKVVVRNWRPWVERGVHEVTNPMGFFSRLKLDYPVSMGSYRFPRRPDEPMVLHLVHVPSLPGAGLDQRDLWRAGRGLLYAATFASFEDKVRDELGRMFGPAGFDAARDIAAITVNRWGHGYAYTENSLFDRETRPAPYEVARRRVGRIAIANSDAGWGAYAHAAIDEAHRAVGELLPRPAAKKS
jgi:spermidine dehydrogenase